MQYSHVRGAESPSRWAALRAAYPQSGLWPILIGDDEALERLEENLEDAQSTPTAILTRADRIAMPQWFERQLAEEPEIYTAEIGNWPKGKPDDTGLVAHLDVLTRKPLKRVHLVELPIQESCAAFAHLQFGGWNDCPQPEVHVAAHRWWHQKYGAEVISISGDVVQCLVARPPADATAALQLAREQYAYCYDIVDQGVETLSNLAASLKGAQYWYFWWD